MTDNESDNTLSSLRPRTLTVDYRALSRGTSPIRQSKPNSTDHTSNLHLNQIHTSIHPSPQISVSPLKISLQKSRNLFSNLQKNTVLKENTLNESPTIKHLQKQRFVNTRLHNFYAPRNSQDDNSSSEDENERVNDGSGIEYDTIPSKSMVPTHNSSSQETPRPRLNTPAPKRRSHRQLIVDTPQALKMNANPLLNNKQLSPTIAMNATLESNDQSTVLQETIHDNAAEVLTNQQEELVETEIVFENEFINSNFRNRDYFQQPRLFILGCLILAILLIPTAHIINSRSIANYFTSRQGYDVHANDSIDNKTGLSMPDSNLNASGLELDEEKAIKVNTSHSIPNEKQALQQETTNQVLADELEEAQDLKSETIFVEFNHTHHLEQFQNFVDESKESSSKLDQEIFLLKSTVNRLIKQNSKLTMQSNSQNDQYKSIHDTIIQLHKNADTRQSILDALQIQMKRMESQPAMQMTHQKQANYALESGGARIVKRWSSQSFYKRHWFPIEYMIFTTDGTYIPPRNARTILNSNNEIGNCFAMKG